ncbi:hypothetical protein [Actinoallomurus rhizosphaericola]|uniref:hypothetical protein n=1 Tax=Actinoallomurus rhizosphaericola TaxID=2952536 RepID=UPI0020930CE6|nr:hypothetical protein [Actinoallomurus rhizosphaericola]MCO5998161.1 hypothetical protein [Actinoallomurus rhizosphaericola]
MSEPSTAYGDNPTLPALRRHFEDLRDGTHGGVEARADKEERFADTVVLLAPYARRVLAEIDRSLLEGTGRVDESGLCRTEDGGLAASWTLSWPEQRAAGVRPITLEAHFERGFHHPHLRGATVGEWPLNVFTDQQAAAEVCTMRAVAAADLHNLVFQRDYRLVPAITRPGPRDG